MKIKTKQFDRNTDLNLVWDFLVEVYERGKGGVAAPFFEYAIASAWLDKNYLFMDRLWLEGDRIVAFAFYDTKLYRQVWFMPAIAMTLSAMTGITEKSYGSWGRPSPSTMTPGTLFPA